MLNIKINYLLIGFVLLLSVHFTSAQDSVKIKKHLKYLGSDLFEGRGTGTIGSELAAKYIAFNLNKHNITPLGYENTFYQYVPMHGSKATNKSYLIVLGNGKVENNIDTLLINDDFLFAHAAGRIFTPNPIPIVFVGYGITANEYNYDDYKNVNVEGKMVVFLEGEPWSNKKDFFKGNLKTIYSFPDTKQKIALSKGAVGTIQIPSFTGKTNVAWNKLIEEYNFEDITLAYLPTPVLSVLLNPKAANNLFNNSKYSYEKIKKMYSQQKLKSFELNKRLLLHPDIIRRDFLSPNIVGFIEGADVKLKNEYIVVSAHYDHLGIGIPVNGDSIYNGVLDNAIGVSALLELSRILGTKNIALKRSIIFLFVTGEEKGLLGSNYFVEHLPIGKENIIADINIDGLAVWGDFKSIIGVGANFSSLQQILKKVAYQNNLIIEELPQQFDAYESFLRSDQLTFALAGIPSILISDGFRYTNFSKKEILLKWKDYMMNKYHTPFDDLTQKINYKASVKHVKILLSFLKELANTNINVEWKNNSPFQK